MTVNSRLYANNSTETEVKLGSCKSANDKLIFNIQLINLKKLDNENSFISYNIFKYRKVSGN